MVTVIPTVGSDTKKTSTMKKYIFMTIAATVALGGCSKEEVGSADIYDNDCGNFFATIEDAGTKTVLDGQKVNWEVGDMININGVAYRASAVGTNATQATFEKTGDTPAAGSTFDAYYPASIYDGTTATLPATQAYEEGKISNLPMYAHSDSHDLVFKNLCGVLKITVPQSVMRR